MAFLVGESKRECLPFFLAEADEEALFFAVAVVE
jgi:hypothetical protein